MRRVRYAPLPWVHLADALRPSDRRIRVVLENDSFDASRAFVRLYEGRHANPVTDARKVLDDKRAISARERAALEILAEAGPSHAKKDHFGLTRAQLGRLLTFASDIAIEVGDQGGLVLSTKPAHLAGRVVEGEEGAGLVFEATEDDGESIDGARVVGEAEAFILSTDRRLFRVDPPHLPGEARALLSSEPLILQGLATDEGRDAFDAVVRMGVDLSELLDVAQPSEPPARIMLRALLTDGDEEHTVGLRVHLVTELGHGGAVEEVEIPARGALPPVFAIYDGDPMSANGAANGDAAGLHLVARPLPAEEEARRALFDLGLTAAGSHRGFTALGENALDILVQLANGEKIPESIEVDKDTLPEIIRLPDRPLLAVKKATGKNKGLLSVNLDISDAAREMALQFEDVAKAVRKGNHSLLLDEDEVLAFTPQAGTALEMVSDALELKSADATRQVGEAELALLLMALGDTVEVDCPPGVKKRLAAFAEGPKKVDREVPDEVQATLRPYQVEGLAWLAHLQRLGLGRILADDMGLGKTLMTLTLLAKAKKADGTQPNLVVAPTSVLDVWVDEAKRHVPSLKVLKWHGRDRVEKEELAADVDVVVTSYALLRRDVDGALGKIAFRTFILDEAQQVKNPRTEAWKAARAIDCEQRLALTGTPIENRVEDLWSILELVAPGILGPERVFQRRYGQPIAKGDEKRLEELRRRVRPMVLRRKKEDVASELPPKIETVMRCDMEDEQRALYLRVLAEVRTDVQKALDIHKGARARAPILAALTRLRQVCCDPRLVLGEKKKKIPSAKVELFAEVIRECLASGRRAIVFSQFVKMQQILHEVLKEVGVDNALWLHGGTRNRGEIIQEFQKPDGPPVIVVSLKAGGTGVTLTAADTVIHYDPWWNPAVEDQATDRAHRIGQEKTVHVIKLACEDTIEERILAMAEGKRAAAESVLGRDKAGPKSLSMDELRGLLDIDP
jgi:superfamily II DNA or RNA helicase